ncbi:MAG: 2-oxoacid:acceptor oxidoreductase family protein, partial [Candidatus Omnitrophica bacterium]|nr:2-oxoacid:acceptor oxidoreductase family protein [Candidatus Omnitrophota bacterium]
DASKISIETIGREIPNTPMMGALIKITGILNINSVLKDIKHKLELKFRNRPEVIEGNLTAVQQAYNQVKTLH